MCDWWVCNIWLNFFCVLWNGLIDLKWFLLNVSMDEWQSIDSSNSISIRRWIVTWNSKEFIRVFQSVLRSVAWNYEKILHSYLDSSDFMKAIFKLWKDSNFIVRSDNAPVLIKFNLCSFQHTFFLSSSLSYRRVRYVCFQSKLITLFVAMICEKRNENHHKTQCENGISKHEWQE